MSSKNYDPSDAFWAVAGFAYLDAKCDYVPDIKDGEGIAVKGKHGVLGDLKTYLKLLDAFPSQDGNEISNVKNAIKSWIIYFTSEYKPEGKILSLKSYYLEKDDADKLSDDVTNWIGIIIDTTVKRKTKLIKDFSFEKFLPSRLIKKLEKGIRQDLKDGFDLTGSDSPTAAVIILLRSAEGIIKNYYKQITNMETSKIRLNDMIEELEKIHNIDKTLVNHLHYIRGKRNEAAHSGKRFTQEDSEKMLIHIKDLLEEIKS